MKLDDMACDKSCWSYLQSGIEQYTRKQLAVIVHGNGNHCNKLGLSIKTTLNLASFLIVLVGSLFL